MGAVGAATAATGISARERLGGSILAGDAPRGSALLPLVIGLGLKPDLPQQDRQGLQVFRSERQATHEAAPQMALEHRQLAHSRPAFIGQRHQARAPVLRVRSQLGKTLTNQPVNVVLDALPPQPESPGDPGNGQRFITEHRDGLPPGRADVNVLAHFLGGGEQLTIKAEYFTDEFLEGGVDFGRAATSVPPPR